MGSDKLTLNFSFLFLFFSFVLDFFGFQCF